MTAADENRHPAVWNARITAVQQGGMLKAVCPPGAVSIVGSDGCVCCVSDSAPGDTAAKYLSMIEKAAIMGYRAS